MRKTVFRLAVSGKAGPCYSDFASTRICVTSRSLSHPNSMMPPYQAWRISGGSIRPTSGKGASASFGRSGSRRVCQTSRELPRSLYGSHL